MASTTRQIALLRGINLARNRRLSMADLRDVVDGLGYEGVRTDLQRGNFVLTAKASPSRVALKLEQELDRVAGMDVKVVVRTRDELAEAIAADPFGDTVNKPSWYQVTFLSEKPSPEVVRELENEDFSPEQVAVRGREIYAWHPAGMNKSRLAKVLSGKDLGVVATARNWNTVTKLLAIADEG